MTDRLILDGSDHTVTVAEGNDFNIIGTCAFEEIVVENGASVQFAAGTGDRVEVAGSLSSFDISSAGNQLILSDSEGSDIAIALNAEMTIAFSDGSTTAFMDTSGSLPKVTLGNEIVDDGFDYANVELDESAPDVESQSVTISGIDHDSLLPMEGTTVAALYEGDSWLNLQDASDPVTYSFNETLPGEYSGSDTYGWQPVASHVRNVIDEVMSNTDGMILPDIEQASGNGQIRFNMVETDSGIAAYAYYPGSGVGGDVFLGHDVGMDSESGNVDSYGNGRSTIVHELGHALGLTHPFEGASVLPGEEDHSANTVMSYTNFRIQVPEFTSTETATGSSVKVEYAMVVPDHFMPYDIAALQAVYGPDTDYHLSGDTYSFGEDIFYTTIWDAGGHDTLDVSAADGYNVIDLTPGGHSDINFRDMNTQIADQQEAYRQELDTDYYDDWVADMFNDIAGELYTGENALGIAYGTIIEDVTGGPAGNSITDNAVDNSLTGGAGDDLFYLGAGGFDTVDGGDGYDLVVLDQYTMDQVELGSLEDFLLLAGDGFGAQMLNIAGVQFVDQLYTV